MTCHTIQTRKVFLLCYNPASHLSPIDLMLHDFHFLSLRLSGPPCFKQLTYLLIQLRMQNVSLKPSIHVLFWFSSPCLYHLVFLFCSSLLTNLQSMLICQCSGFAEHTNELPWCPFGYLAESILSLLILQLEGR